MKKFIALAVSVFFLAAGIQAQDGRFMYSEEFTLQFKDEVTIKIGGATQKKSTSEWEQGGKVGKHTIDPKLFQQLKESTSGKFRIEIEKKKIGTLHGIRVTDLENDKVLKGIYNEKDRKFTFGDARTQQANGATKTDIGVVKGQFNEDMTAITDGDFGLAFILGNAGAMISANAVFYFTAELAK